MAEVDLDGGGVDMDTDPTDAVMTTLSGISTGFRSAWDGHLNTINGLDGQLGQGPMGREFAAVYGPASRSLSGSASQVAGTLERKALVGQACVRIYLDVDAANKQRFQS